MITIMEKNINLEQDFTMADIISKEFVLYLRDYIKELVSDQKIAKRDRKYTKHPCPEKRKYACWEATEKVMNQRKQLCDLYEVYYFIKKNKEFDWTSVTFKPVKNWNGKYSYSVKYFCFSDVKDYKTLQNASCIDFHCLINVIKKYVENGK